MRVPGQPVVAGYPNLEGRHTAEKGIGPEGIFAVLLFVHLHLMNGAFPVRHITLIHHLAFQRRLAVHCCNHKKNKESDKVREQSGKKAFLHNGLFKRDKISPFGLILLMRWLLFLSRLAFICNVFFLLAVSLQLFRWFQNQDAEATVIILGYVMVLFFNPVANLCYLFLFFRSPAKLQAVPKWVMVANALFLLFQILYIIFLHDR